MEPAKMDAVAVARELGAQLAKRAATHDADDSFVADNYQEFKKHKLFSAGVPCHLGGGGASHPELCGMLNELAHYCSSSALALSMHTHVLATMVCRYKHGAVAVEPLLKRIANEELILVTSGGSDWLDGSGKAEKVEGGFRVTGRKIFSSGCPSGELLMTTAVYEDPLAGPTVLHVPVPLNGPGIQIHDNWRAMGMRGTGSNDITIEGVFVPGASVLLRRPRGKWDPFFDVLSPVVWPLVMAVYVGVAEAARVGSGKRLRFQLGSAERSSVGPREVCDCWSKNADLRRPLTPAHKVRYAPETKWSDHLTNRGSG